MSIEDMKRIVEMVFENLRQGLQREPDAESVFRVALGVAYKIRTQPPTEKGE